MDFVGRWVYFFYRKHTGVYRIEQRSTVYHGWIKVQDIDESICFTNLPYQERNAVLLYELDLYLLGKR